MENQLVSTGVIQEPAASLPRGRVASFLSYITFSVPSLRLLFEMSFSFIIFEVVVQIAVFQGQTPTAAEMIALWIASCFFIASLDAAIFLPAIKIYNMAYKFSRSEKYVSALKAIELLDPAQGRLVHLPKELFHLEKAKFLADLDNFDEARAEIEKVITKMTQEIKDLAAEIMKAQQNFGDIETLELDEVNRAIAKVDEAFSGSGSGINRELLREARGAFSKAKMGHHPDWRLAELYFHATNLFLGAAEDSFPNLLRNLRPLESASSHYGKLYLIRAFYASTHNEKELARADMKLGELLTRPYQLKQLKRKVREELGESLHEKSNNYYADKHPSPLS
jgi:hypothetical protein